MQQLTPAAESFVNQVAERYRISSDAVRTLLIAVSRGGGTMAQFYHSELGGAGQWMSGGMTMVGDMFNSGLQYTVANVCTELSNFLANQPAFVPPPQAPAQSQFQGGSYGSFSSYSWWPSELGSPSASGGQNDSRYAYFPHARRLAVQHNGQISVYDTLDHQIGGVQQQQGSGSGSQTFSSQFGTFSVDSLPLVSGVGVSAPSAPSSPPPAYAPAQGDEPGDVLSKLERLGALRDRGLVTEQEFQAKKAELLSRL